VELGMAAEQAGFDFVATSDHLQPWQANEGHSGLAWVTLSALGQRTRRISSVNAERADAKVPRKEENV
jgi:alkanesulfonate monooxygenase SsuD/methylene tetrahydromethanopterin reductase-like flavin-dependent oxidoreductase (luciferase family)